MGKHAQLVIGPAGSGKSTYVDAMRRHCEDTKRSVHCVNLDPAAETFSYPVSIDIRDLISVTDSMEELKYGPNGGLVFCMEFLVANLNWLEDQIDDFSDDYLIIDCPGQIELYSHLPVMKTLVKRLENWGYHICAVYLIDSLMIQDTNRFFAGVMMCLSAMVQLELPHINILSKADLIQDKRLLQKFFEPEAPDLLRDLEAKSTGRHRHLNRALSSLIENYSMVSFIPLDNSNQDNLALVLAHIDRCTQYGEDLEPREPRAEGPEDNDGTTPS